MAEFIPIPELDDATLARRFQNADALAKQGDKQAAEAARAMAQEINRRRGSTGPRRIGASDGQNVAQQWASGMTEGLTRNVAGPVVDAAQGVLNLPKRAYDAARGQEYDPWLEGSVGTTQWWDDTLNTPIPDMPLPFTDDVLAMGPLVSPPPEGTLNTFARKSGEFTGTALGTIGGATALANTGLSLGRYGNEFTRGAADMAVKHPGKSLLAETIAGATATAAGAGGGAVGERVAPKLGFSPEIGRATGEFAGEMIGGLGGATLAYGAGDLGRAMWQDPESAARYTAASRLGVETTPGVVGNEAAQYLENTAGLNPLAGRMIRGQQQRQVAQTEESGVLGVADPLRAPTNTPRPTGKGTYDAGLQVRGAGQDALARVRADLGRLTQQEMAALGGRDQAIGIDRLKNKIQNLIPDQTPEGRKYLQRKYDELEQMRITGYDDLGAPTGTPKNAQLDAQLRTKLKTQTDAQTAREKTLADLEAKRDAGTATAQELRQARNLRSRMPGYNQAIDRTIAQIDKNLGVRNVQLDKWRREIGQEIGDKAEGTAGITEQKDVYGALRQDQSLEAQQRGTEGEFRSVVEEKRRLAGTDTTLEDGGDANFLRNLTETGAGTPKEAQDVWKFLTADNAAGRIQRYRENVRPEEFEATIGNLVDVMGRPTSQGARAGATNTETFSPTIFMTNWKNLPKAVQDQIFDASQMEQRLKDLETVASALSARGKAANVSGTTATAIIATVFRGTGGPKEIGLTLATLGSNAALARAFMSDRVARAIADVNPGLAEELKVLFPVRGAAAVQTDTDMGGPQ